LSRKGFRAAGAIENSTKNGHTYMSDNQASRDKAQAFVTHLINDADFRAKAVADPEGSLAAAGLTPAAMTDWIKEGNADSEVSGYMASEGCDLFSCWVSIHPGLFCGTTH
jgi:hypothetical protein